MATALSSTKAATAGNRAFTSTCTSSADEECPGLRADGCIIFTMSIKETIEAELKNAMRSGDEVRKTALRSVIAGIKLAAVDNHGALTDEEAQNVIRKEIKSQRESIADAQKASRADLVERAEAIITILEAFLP